MKPMGKAICLFAAAAFILANTFLTKPASAEQNAFQGNVHNILSKTVVVYKGSPKAYVYSEKTHIDPSRGVHPVEKDGSLLIPIRFVSRSLGAEIGWDKQLSEATITLNDRTIKLKPNSSKMSINNSNFRLNVPVQYIKGRMFVPARTITEALDKRVVYYNDLVIIGDYGDLSGVTLDNQSLNAIIAMLKEEQKTRTIPVLMYHHFQHNVPDDLTSTTVTPSEFEGHLKYLKENGYTSISLQELYDFIHGKAALPDKPFIITMDDGYESNYTYAFPLLRKYETKAAIFIVTSFVGKDPEKFKHFSWEEAREMEASGLVDIQNHSHWHGRHGDMSEQEIMNSISTAQRLIEQNLGPRSIQAFAYPGGNRSSTSRKIVSKLGFDIQLTGLNRLVTINTDLSDIHRISIRHGMTGRDIVASVEQLKKK